MADKVVFVMHKAVRVFDRPVVTTKGDGRPDQPYVFKDAWPAFEVREADEREVRENDSKRQADVDAAVERLKMKAAVEARVVDLRREQAIQRRVGELRRQQAQVDE